MKCKYLKDNDSYFRFINKNKGKITDVEVSFTKNNIKVKYRITQ